jgi:hypothetical protein
VERNRVKRLLREAFAVESERLPPGTDAVVIARPDAKGLAEREGLAGIARALGELIERAGGAEASGRVSRDEVEGAASDVVAGGESDVVETAVSDAVEGSDPADADGSADAKGPAAS